MAVNPSAAGGAAAVNSVYEASFGDLDVMSAAQLVLTKKSQLFNNRLETMVADMKASNDKISQMTQASAQLTALKNDFKSDAKNDTKMSDGSGAIKYKENVSQNDRDAAAKSNLTDLAQNASTTGVSAKAQETTANLAATAQTLVNAGVLTDAQAKDLVSGNMTYGQIDTAITSIKQKTDSLSSDANLQQIQLNRLIGLKDNVDNLLSTIVKKVSDVLAQIISKLS